MDKYLYAQFEPTQEYRDRVIEFLRHNTNVEIGGYRIFDGTRTHYMQNPVEITDFVFAAKEQEKRTGRKFESFLEIGFSAGINNTLLNKFFEFKNHVAIDQIDSSGTGGSAFLANLRFKNLSLVCGNSMDPETIRKVGLLGKYDLIFIDGGHDYETVRADFFNYSGFLNPGGIIAFHDIVARDIPGPARFWSELKAGQGAEQLPWRFDEFVDQGNHTDYGIGMMTMDTPTAGR